MEPISKSLEFWAEENVDGLAKHETYGLIRPADPCKVKAAYERAFHRFQPLADIGKRKFVGGNIKILGKIRFKLKLMRNFSQSLFKIFWSTIQTPIRLVVLEMSFWLNQEQGMISS